VCERRRDQVSGMIATLRVTLCADCIGVCMWALAQQPGPAFQDLVDAALVEDAPAALRFWC
jgi:hypothetical protein